MDKESIRMYLDIDLGLVYLLLRITNRPLIRTKLNDLVKVGWLGLSQLSLNKTYFDQAHSFLACTTDLYTLPKKLAFHI